MRPARSSAREDEVSLGHVSGIFGLHGEVRLFLHNRETELFDRELPVTLVAPDGSRRDAPLRMRTGAGGRVIGRLPGLRDREAARALMGWEILIAKSALPEPQDDEFYHHELLGVPVEDESGRALGVLAEIHSTGEVDVWVVRPSGGGEDLYVPALFENIVEVGPERIVISDELI